MHDQPHTLSLAEKIMRRVVMPFVFLFFPPFPRRIVRKYKKRPFSPDNLVNYIAELSAHPQFENRGGPGGLSPDYYLLHDAVLDYQVDELRFTTDPAEVYLLRQHELAILGSQMYTEQALQDGSELPLSEVEDYMDWCRQSLPRTIQYDPILKRWLTIVHDTPNELIVQIGGTTSSNLDQD